MLFISILVRPFWGTFAKCDPCDTKIVFFWFVCTFEGSTTHALLLLVESKDANLLCHQQLLYYFPLNLHRTEVNCFGYSMSTSQVFVGIFKNALNITKKFISPHSLNHMRENGGHQKAVDSCSFMADNGQHAAGQHRKQNKWPLITAIFPGLEGFPPRPLSCPIKKLMICIQQSDNRWTHNQSRASSLWVQFPFTQQLTRL